MLAVTVPVLQAGKTAAEIPEIKLPAENAATAGGARTGTPGAATGIDPEVGQRGAKNGTGGHVVAMNPSRAIKTAAAAALLGTKAHAENAATAGGARTGTAGAATGIDLEVGRRGAKNGEQANQLTKRVGAGKDTNGAVMAIATVTGRRGVKTGGQTKRMAKRAGAEKGTNEAEMAIVIVTEETANGEGETRECVSSRERNTMPCPHQLSGEVITFYAYYYYVALSKKVRMVPGYRYYAYRIYRYIIYIIYISG